MPPTPISELGVRSGAMAPIATPSSGVASSTPIGFVTLYRDRYDAMVRLAALLVDRTEQAEEIVQDAFAAVYERWEHVDVPAAYVRTVVVNRCRDALTLARGRRCLHGDASTLSFSTMACSSGSSMRPSASGIGTHSRLRWFISGHSDRSVVTVMR